MVGCSSAGVGSAGFRAFVFVFAVWGLEGFLVFRVSGSFLGVERVGGFWGFGVEGVWNLGLRLYGFRLLV